MDMKKSLRPAFIAAAFALAAMVCIRGSAAEVYLDDDYITLKKSGPTAYVTDPKKGSISLDLEVDEDSSVYTLTVMVELENLNAAEVEPFVKKGLSKYGSVSTNAAANILVITDREPKLSDIVSFVRKMDRMDIDDFVQLKTEVIYLDNVQASGIVDIVSKRLSGEGTVQSDDNLNVLVVTDVEGKIDYVKDIIEQLDRPPQQVIIEAKIVQIYGTDFSDVGIDLSALLNRGSLGYRIDKVSSKTFQPASTRSQRGKRSDAIFSNTADQIVNVLVGSGRAKLIATPRIVTVNNKKGSIKIEVPIQFIHSYTYFSRLGETVTVEDYRPGLFMEAIPHIGAGNLITIDFGASTGEPVVPTTTSSNLSLPSTLERKTIETTIVVREGETFVVGGFEQEYQSHTKRKTPILGDIPIIKEAFTKKVKYNYISQTLFFLTPRIIKDESNPPDDEELKTSEPD